MTEEKVKNEKDKKSMENNDSAIIVDQTTKATAKAGKRSAKALKEAEEKVAKEIKKSEQQEQSTKPKAVIIPTRSRLERRSKKYQEASKLIDSKQLYTAEKAIELAKKTSTTKFDSTIELHINLGVDPRHADQNIRDTLVLPAGTGKNIKVAVFAEDASDSGADIFGVDEITALLEKNVLKFDVLISTPSLMPKLGKYARVLGPRGLMPNPKSGTVTTDVNKAVKEAKAGKVEYRVDSAGIVHIGIGKSSFDTKNLIDNYNAVIASIKHAKPSSVKGTYIKGIFITSSMGPSIKIDSTGL